MCPIAHMSKKDVKLSKRCQVVKKMSNVKKSNTCTMEEVHKKINWHNEVHTYWTSILTSHMMVTKIPQIVHRKCFWTILVTFIFDVKIDVNMCEPHYVNLFFLWTSSIVQVFDFLTFDIFLTNCHLFDILTSFNLNHLSPSQGYFLKIAQHLKQVAETQYNTGANHAKIGSEAIPLGSEVTLLSLSLRNHSNIYKQHSTNAIHSKRYRFRFRSYINVPLDRSEPPRIS